MRRLVWSMALAAMAACGGSDAAESGVIRSDSAGVKIFTSPGVDRDLAWQFEEIAVYKDSVGEPWLFERLSQSRVLTDRINRTYVLDPEKTIRRFGADGTYEMSFGRSGQGPGEMMGPNALQQQGDSLVVLDGARQALVRWGPDFHPIAEIPLRGPLEFATKVAFRNGGLWYERSPRPGTRALFADTLGAAPLISVESDSRPKVLNACGSNIGFLGGPTFAPTLSWSVAGPRMLATVGPEYDLRLYQGSRLLASIRRDIPPRAPNDDDIQRMWPTGGISMGPCTIPASKVMETLGVAERIGVVWGLVLLTDGTMWAQRNLPQDTAMVLDVFGADGAYAGTLRGWPLPVGAFKNEDVLIPRADPETGGFYLVRYRIRR